MVSRVGILFNPVSTSSAQRWREIQDAARSLGVPLHPLEVYRADELEPAFATATSAGVGALIVLRNFSRRTGPGFSSWRPRAGCR